MKMTLHKTDLRCPNGQGMIYELYDANRRLLYVGQAVSVARLVAHLENKVFGHLIEEVDYLLYPIAVLSQMEEKTAWELQPEFGSRWGYDLRRDMQGVWRYCYVPINGDMSWESIVQRRNYTPKRLRNGQPIQYDGKIDNNSH